RRTRSRAPRAARAGGRPDQLRPLEPAVRATCHSVPGGSLLKKLLLVVLALLCLPAAAQDYPNRPVRLIVPFAPGGASDILGRLVGERLGALYKQSSVVENRPGASGHLGAQQVAKAPGDGYTLMSGTIGIHAAYASYSKLGYDPATELQPIIVLG